LGVAPRVLSGWAPSELTEYEYDEGGRLLRSLSITESPFDVEQVDLLLAIREYQRGLDQNGIPFERATSDQANPNPTPGSEQSHPVRFLAHGPFTNWAEKSRLDAEDAYKKQSGDDVNLNGMFWTVEEKTYAPNPDADAT